MTYISYFLLALSSYCFSGGYLSKNIIYGGYEEFYSEKEELFEQWDAMNNIDFYCLYLRSVDCYKSMPSASANLDKMNLR